MVLVEKVRQRALPSWAVPAKRAQRIGADYRPLHPRPWLALVPAPFPAPRLSVNLRGNQPSPALLWLRGDLLAGKHGAVRHFVALQPRTAGASASEPADGVPENRQHFLSRLSHYLAALASGQGPRWQTGT